MKKLDFYLFARCLTLLILAILSTNLAWGADASIELCTSWNKTLAYATAYTQNYTIDDLNGGTTTMTLGVQGVYRQSNANTYFQMNKKTGYFKNTTKLPGKITKIETTWSVNKPATKCYFATNAAASSSDKTVTVAAATSVTYTPPTDADYYYFNIDVSTGSGSAQMTSCKVYYEKSNTPVAELVSIAISGTPTKTTYETGESFDPAGLTVTGTYDDASTADLTADAKWTFDPATFTSTSQTSVSVTATVDGKSDTKSYDVTVKEFVQTYANTYTSDASLSSVITGSKVKWEGCKVTDGYDALKIAKGTTATITVPAGTKTVHLHMVAWNGESANVTIKKGTETLATITPTADGGVSGTTTTYKIAKEPNIKDSYYFAIDVNNNQEITLSISTASSKRAILFGVNFEPDKTLESIAISGTPTKTEYFVGESFNPAGLTVTGHYNNGTQATITEGITWTITPETFTETTQTSVSVTATVGNITSGAYEVTGLTVTSPASLYTLTAEPAEGGSYTVTVGEDPAVEVTAEAKQFMVTEGTVIVVEATANEHYKVHSTPFEGKYADETQITFENTGVAKKKQFTYGTADATITAKFLQMYAVNIDANIEHGTVVADPVENTPTSVITLTLTPDAHYHFESVTVKDKNGGDIALEGEPITTEEGITTAKFKMPAAEDTKGAVSVTATFAEDAKYTVTFSVNGENTTSDANYAGEPVEFPTVSPIAGYTFMGWTEQAIDGKQDDAPEFVENATYPDNNDAVFYAVFAKKEGGEEKSEELTNDEIKSWGKLAYNTEKTYKGTDLNYSIYGFMDADNRHWIQLKKDEGVYVKITAPSNIKKVDVKITSASNSSGGINDISKHTAFGGTVGLVTTDCTFTESSENVGSTNDVKDDNVATIPVSGDEKELYLKVSIGARVWSITTHYGTPPTFSNYTTTVTTTATMSITSAKWSTFIAPFDVEIPEGVEAYTVTATEEALVYTPVETTITACTPVVLFKDVTETYKQNFVGVDNAEERTFQTESLVGTLDALAKGEVPTTTESDVPVYLLQKQNEKVGFFKLDPTKQYSLNANRAYLVGVATANAKAYYGFDDNDPTGISNLRGERWNVPREGIFDLSGRKLSAPQKGVNIINGIKVIVK